MDDLAPVIKFIIGGVIFAIVVTLFFSGISWVFTQPLIWIPLLLILGGLGYLAAKSHRARTRV
jgi:hypothetical protein